MKSDLPYHCPTLNGNYLRSPCAGQVAAAEVLRAKFAHAVMPYGLEQCLKCKGAVLVKREAASVEYTGDIRPVVTREVSTIREDRIVQEERPEMGMANEVAPEPQARFSPRCPKHPDEPQVQCGPDSKRSGQYLGACMLCMAERKVGRKSVLAKEKMTPAVARNLLEKKSAVAESPAGDVITYPLSAFADEGVVAAPQIHDTPTCKNHPDRPGKINRLGRPMGLCPECLSTRGRKAGIENYERGLTAPPVSIPLNQGKYAVIKAWLEAQAEENERTLQAEIIFRLKLAMRLDEGRENP